MTERALHDPDACRERLDALVEHINCIACGVMPPAGATGSRLGDLVERMTDPGLTRMILQTCDVPQAMVNSRVRKVIRRYEGTLEGRRWSAALETAEGRRDGKDVKAMVHAGNLVLGNDPVVPGHWPIEWSGGLPIPVPKAR